MILALSWPWASVLIVSIAGLAAFGCVLAWATTKTEK